MEKYLCAVGEPPLTRCCILADNAHAAAKEFAVKLVISGYRMLSGPETSATDTVYVEDMDGFLRTFEVEMSLQIKCTRKELP